MLKLIIKLQVAVKAFFCAFALRHHRGKFCQNVLRATALQFAICMINQNMAFESFSKKVLLL